jgi:hypothetical protein
MNNSRMRQKSRELTILSLQKYLGRDSPSYRKLDYLLHLQDHLGLMQKLFEPMLEVPVEWPASEEDHSDSHWVEKFKIYFTYILEEIAEIQKDAKEIQKMVKFSITRSKQPFGC